MVALTKFKALRGSIPHVRPANHLKMLEKHIVLVRTATSEAGAVVEEDASEEVNLVEDDTSLYGGDEEDEKKREEEESKIREEIMRKFPRKGVLQVEAPKLNPEILAYMSGAAKSRDKHFVASQNAVGSTMIAVAKSISLILELEEGEISNTLLKLLGNAGKLLAGVHYQHSVMRRAFILPGIDEKYRELLKKSDITDDLFGKDLFKRLKHTKSMGKDFQLGKPKKPAVEFQGPFAAGSERGPTKIAAVQGSAEKFPVEQTRGYEVDKAKPTQSLEAAIPTAPLLQGNQSLDDVKKAIDNLLVLGAIRPWSPRIHNEGSSRYLRFIFQGQCFEFLCLPFGLNVAPHVFTKVLRPVVNHLRKEGFASVIYLDDMFLVASSKRACAANIKASIELLENLGFVINYKKSSLDPSQRAEFLGITYDFCKMALELPEHKKQKMLSLLKEFRPGKICSLRRWSSFVGSINACCPAVRYGRLYTKELERIRYLELLKNNDDYDAEICIPKNLESVFKWWEENIPGSSNPIRQDNYKLEIFSDASTTGWGVFSEGERAGGFWTENEQKLHINRLELIAALFALKSFASEYRNCEILLRIDNTTAVAYINKMGGVQHPNLHRIAKEIWQWCKIRDIWLVASYIKSEDNVEADRESRVKNIDTEWELASYAFYQAVRAFGRPRVDLFATRCNTKCKEFFAWKKDPEASAIDAFTVNWGLLGLFWAFPPFVLILKVLKKIIVDRATGIVVHSTPASREAVPDGRKIIRESFRRKGLPDPALDIFEASLMESTHKQYAGPLKQWWSFCSSRGLDPYQPEEGNVIQFLTKKFEKGAAYGSLNSARSAISLISERNLGQNRNIARFFKGVFMLRPVKPKYDRIWDVDIALRKIEEWFPLDELSLDQLSERLVLLLALGTAHRVQTLASIKLPNIKRNSEGYEIEIPDRIKTSRPGAYQPLLVLPFFPENPKLCIRSTLDTYIQETAQIRGEVDNLLLTTKKPFRAASKVTISR
ncbi:uncharacterized protein [Temnothorax nylanderi]|uniref:uncharacterized protein n=1 Tax=Temnothorax nylanderi TaxID=102681 RepID=UPI003A84F677